MGKFWRFVSGLYRDGLGAIGFIAPILSVITSILKLLDVDMKWLRELSWAWVFVPITVWLLIAYIRRWLAYEKRYEQNPEPDFSMIDAWVYLLLDSKWASGRNPAPYQEFHEAALMQIRDAASLRKLNFWGRPHKRDITTNAMRPVELSSWDKVTIWTAAPNGLLQSANIEDHATGEKFDEVMVNKRQFKALWPKAGPLQKHRDKALESRKRYLYGTG